MAHKAVWLTAFLSALICGAVQASESGVALVVGNSSYSHAPPLVNPRNDAEDMAALLRRLGFQVIAGLDLDKAAMEDRVRAFSRQARAAQVALFFYAGHGLQVNGVNHLVPVDAQLADADDLDFEALSLDKVLKRMGGGTNLVFLDACRDNPFARGWASDGRSVSVGRGLTRVGEASGSGLFIAFATDPDSIAADGDGRNSPFTAALKRHIETPGLEINHLLTEVRKAVLASTGNVQRPWSNSSLSDAFYFVNPVSGASVSSIAVDVPDPATEMWLQVRGTTNAETLERFLATYPHSSYRPSAEARLAELQGAAGRVDDAASADDSAPLTVRTGPAAARVQIMNIGPKYHAGIRLPPGRYDIKVTADGYDTIDRTLQHGDEPTEVWIGLPFRDCPVCPAMVEIPAGSYTMGSVSGEERAWNEGPAKKITIESSFAVGVFEVSFEEWEACRQDAGCTRRLDGQGKGKYPAIGVTLCDAVEYVKWLKIRTDKHYFLLPESWWEYAARAGTTSDRFWSEGPQCTYANGADITAQRTYSYSAIADCDDGHTHAAPSDDKRFRPNPWGLYHMLGNVTEWTADCWHDNYVDMLPDGLEWSGDCSPGHVARGGSWNSTSSELRAPRRFEIDPERTWTDVGFRVGSDITLLSRPKEIGEGLCSRL